MPKYSNFDESRLIEASKAALFQKKPNIAKIAREFGVTRTTLSDRVKNARSATRPTKCLKNILHPRQEKASVYQIAQMYSWNLPPTAAVIQAWKNHAFKWAG